MVEVAYSTLPDATALGMRPWVGQMNLAPVQDRPFSAPRPMMGTIVPVDLAAVPSPFSVELAEFNGLVVPAYRQEPAAPGGMMGPAEPLLYAITLGQELTKLDPTHEDEVTERYDQRTVDYAASVAISLWSGYRGLFGVDMPIPRFRPGPHGSIDLRWRTPRFQLLVNVPKEAGADVTAFGKALGSLSISATFDRASPDGGLLEWVHDRWAPPP
jgi:hypothetical protein